MIYRIMPEDYKDPSPVKGDVFPDVAADRWSALSIETLAEQDILIGYEDGTFRPEDYITRQRHLQSSQDIWGWRTRQRQII